MGLEEPTIVANAGPLLVLLVIAFLAVLAYVLNGNSGIEIAQQLTSRTPLPAEETPVRFDQPERTTERIGEYMGAPIYRSVFVGGAEYAFDRIVPPRTPFLLSEGERCLWPGIIYSRDV